MTVKRGTGLVFLAVTVLLGLYMLSDKASDAATQQSDVVQVVCTTTFLSTIADALGGEQVDTATIIPYGMCPGHFDLSPGEARQLLDAEVLFRHGYEQFLKDITFNDNMVIHNMDVAGNWMIPDNHLAGVQRIASVLEDIMPDQAEQIARRAEQYTVSVQATADSLLPMLADITETPVICAGMNSDFATWLGFDVIGQYPRDEDISVKTMQDIITRGKNENVRLVIDNMQSSGKVGRTIAENLGVPYVLLTNFPDPESGGNPYIATLAESCTAVVHALGNDSQISMSNMR